MENRQQAFELLVEEFDKLPKIIPQTTYLEICKYPGSRFEEICSRILCFYFKPSNEHGFNDLFLQTLLELISNDKEILYKNDQIEVIDEAYSEKKRLDILIKSPDLVIGIENKIYASVDNPLEIYSNQISQYHKENIFKVILSVKKITDKNELKYIENNGFKILYYSTFFEKLKQNIGRYISQANQKYLIYIYDFIQTIENMTGDTFNNDKLFQFFSKNSADIDELVQMYDKHKQRVFEMQRNRINELMQNVSNLTNVKWWIYDGWNLGYDAFNKNTDKPRIGIESSYKQKGNNPLGEFRIYITTWKLNDFIPYEDTLVKLFPNNFLDKKTKENRVFLHMDIIENDDEKLILEKLQEYYNLLHKIIRDDIISE
jgi:hypothetical protein